MALDKSTLIDDLTEVFSRQNSAGDAALAIANAIDKFVKTASVSTVVSGEVMTGYGAGGSVEGTGEGTLS